MNNRPSFKHRASIVLLWSLTAIFYFFGLLAGIFAAAASIISANAFLLLPILAIVGFVFIFLPLAGLPEIYFENFDPKFVKGILGLNVVGGAIGLCLFAVTANRDNQIVSGILGLFIGTITSSELFKS